MENIIQAFFEDATLTDGAYALPVEARWSTIINTPAPNSMSPLTPPCIYIYKWLVQGLVFWLHNGKSALQFERLVWWELEKRRPLGRLWNSTRKQCKLCLDSAHSLPLEAEQRCRRFFACQRCVEWQRHIGDSQETDSELAVRSDLFVATLLTKKYDFEGMF